MKKRPRLYLFLIGVLILFAIWIDLPKSYVWNGSLFGKQFKIPISNTININWWSNKEITHNYYLKTGLDIQGGSHLVFEADTKQLSENDRIDALESAKNNILERVDRFGVSEPIVQISRTNNSDRIIVELPGIKDVDQAVNLIGRTALLDFRTPIFSSDSAEFVKTDLSGKNLQKALATVDPNTGKNVVQINFDDQGRQLFADLTTKFVGQPMAIFLDDQPISFPIINEPIIGGSAIISGDFTSESAKQLAVQLNAGALPVTINLISQQSIGATLGTESVIKSVQAGLLGLIAVIFFMIAYYGKLGVISTIGLFIYAILSLAIYKILGITLTVPGIAGFLLSVGMAVDANILIFERYKEESRMGKPKLLAMEEAFGRAWDSIKDANVCTIATAGILYYMTSATVKGFAVTLGIGIFLSLFTGIIVSRTLIRSFISKPKKLIR